MVSISLTVNNYGLEFHERCYSNLGRIHRVFITDYYLVGLDVRRYLL